MVCDARCSFVLLSKARKSQYLPAPRLKPQLRFQDVVHGFRVGRDDRIDNLFAKAGMGRVLQAMIFGNKCHARCRSAKRIHHEAVA